jgi:ammonium transporter, Amt family
MYGVLDALLTLIFTKLAAGSLIVTNSANVAVLYSPGDIAWTLASMALVWIMIPGVGYFYSGLLRRKNALSMIYLGMMTIAVVSFQVRTLFPSPFTSI